MENFSLILSDYQKDMCSSSSVFAENLQIVLDISDEEAKNIAENLPFDISKGISKSEAMKLANILEAFGAVVILQDLDQKTPIAEDKDYVPPVVEIDEDFDFPLNTENKTDSVLNIEETKEELNFSTFSDLEIEPDDQDFQSDGEAMAILHEIMQAGPIAEDKDYIPPVIEEDEEDSDLGITFDLEDEEEDKLNIPSDIIESNEESNLSATPEMEMSKNGDETDGIPQETMQAQPIAEDKDFVPPALEEDDDFGIAFEIEEKEEKSSITLDIVEPEEEVGLSATSGLKINPDDDETLFGNEGVTPISFDLEIDDAKITETMDSSKDDGLNIAFNSNNSIDELDLDLDKLLQEAESSVESKSPPRSMAEEVAGLKNISLDAGEEALVSKNEIQTKITASTSSNLKKDPTITPANHPKVEAPQIEHKELAKSEEPEAQISTSPFLEKKRSANKDISKFIGPSLLALVVLLGAVFFFSSGAEEKSTLTIDVNPDLVKSLLQQNKDPKSASNPGPQYSNFVGKFESDALKIEVKVNKADIKIEDLKINLQALADKLTTAEEFISNKFYPHLNSLEISIKDSLGTKTDGWFTFKGSARAFYMYKNKSTKGILDLYIKIKEDNSELVMSNSEGVPTTEAVQMVPRLADINGTATFETFNISIPLNKITPLIPIRNVITMPKPTEDQKVSKKEAKAQKKDKNKSVDE